MLYYIRSPKTAGFGKSASFPAEETQYNGIFVFFGMPKKTFSFCIKMRLCLQQILEGGMENAQ